MESAVSVEGVSKLRRDKVKTCSDAQKPQTPHNSMLDFHRTCGISHMSPGIQVPEEQSQESLCSVRSCALRIIVRLLGRCKGQILVIDGTKRSLLYRTPPPFEGQYLQQSYI